MQNILNYCYDSKIAVHLYCLIGFPTETPEEAKETLSLILKNRKIVNYFGFSVNVFRFQLKKLTKVSRSPSRYEVKVVPEKYNDLSFKHNYKARSGMSMEKVREVSTFIQDELMKVFNKNGLELPIEHMLLYLSHPNIGFNYHPIVKDKTNDFRQTPLTKRYA